MFQSIIFLRNCMQKFRCAFIWLSSLISLGSSSSSSSGSSSSSSSSSNNNNNDDDDNNNKKNISY